MPQTVNSQEYVSVTTLPLFYFDKIGITFGKIRSTNLA